MASISDTDDPPDIGPREERSRCSEGRSASNLVMSHIRVAHGVRWFAVTVGVLEDLQDFSNHGKRPVYFLFRVEVMRGGAQNLH